MKLFFSTLFSLLLLAVNAQNVKITNTADFIQECMKNKGELPHKQVALWIPVNFWSIVTDKMNLPAERIAAINDEMKKYMMVCVVDYTLEQQTGITFKTEDEIRKTIKIIDSSGTEYSPLNNEDVTPLASDILNSFKPVLAQLLGQFGKGMGVFLFKQKMSMGQPAIDITKKNRFMLTWDAVKMDWKLPFVSTLAPKHCPVDHEQM